MDLESSVFESVENNEEVKNVNLFQKVGNNGESEVHINESYLVENDDYNNELHGVKGNGTEVSRSVSLPPVEMNSLASPSPTTTKKGSGLRKWRRIKRDERRGDSSDDTPKMVMHNLSNTVANPSKRIQVHADRKQNSGDSILSTKAVVKSLDAFGLVGGPSFDAGTESDNSEDRSSKYSNAASAPKIKHEHDKSIMKSLTGKNSTLVKKGRIDIIKKARGERVKIEKENSFSSLESDSRSSNVVFMQGTYDTSNGVRSDGPIDCDGENGDEGQGRDGEIGYENILHEDVVDDSSSEVKEEKSQNHNSSTDQDHLIGAIFGLQSAQEALEKEVLKFKELNIEVQSEVAKTTKENVETELEALFKQKIETEVEYLVISRTVQKLRVNAMDQITLLEKHKVEQTQILNKLSNTKNKDAMFMKEDKKLETRCEEIATNDERLKLQKMVRKYTSYLLVQIVCLVIVLGVLMFQLSPNYVEIAPT